MAASIRCAWRSHVASGSATGKSFRRNALIDAISPWAARGTDNGAHPFSPFAQFMFGGRKVTHEVDDLALKEKLLNEWNDGNGTLPHYPQRSALEALRINPSLAGAYLLRAHVHERLRDPNAVIADVDAYFKNASNNDLRVRADALALRQRAHQDLGRASVD